MAEDTVLAGKPLLDLVASVTAPRVHLIGTLYDESPDGERRRISQFAINPELRVGVATPKPVIPGQLMELQPPGFAMAHNLREGHRLVLRFTTSDPDKVPTFAVDPRVTIATGPGGTVLQVPVVGVPHRGRRTRCRSAWTSAPIAGPAQPEETASVTPTAGGPAADAGHRGLPRVRRAGRLRQRRSAGQRGAEHVRPTSTCTCSGRTPTARGAPT